MTQNLELPGYKIVLPSRVWKRVGTPILDITNTLETPLTEVFYAENYREPTTEEIIENICHTASAIHLSPNQGANMQDSLSRIIIDVFKPSGRMHLANRTPGLIDMLKEVIPSRQDSNLNYLHFHSALVPDKVIQSNSEAIEQAKESAYVHLIESVVGFEEWNAWIKLNPTTNTLPELHRLENLFGERVTNSDIIYIDAPKPLLDHIYSRLRSIHGYLFNNEGRIQDTSPHVLDYLSFKTIANHIEEVQARRERSQRSGLIVPALGPISSQNPRFDN
jgi:hypothetical protein